MEPAAELRSKIGDRSARLGVIGLGSVGLPLALEMARAGFHVTGLDSDRARVASLNAGVSYVRDVPSALLRAVLAAGQLRATEALGVLAALDTVSICVPTPLRKTRDPDLSCVVAAAEGVRTQLHPGQLIILESTT